MSKGASPNRPCTAFDAEQVKSSDQATSLRSGLFFSSLCTVTARIRCRRLRLGNDLA